MRRTLSLLIGTALGACSTPTHWQKAGVDESTTADDLADCQRVAREEASRLYVFRFPFPYPLGWAGRQPGYTEWRQRFEAEKAYGESRVADACMRERGYVPVRRDEPKA